MEIAITMNEILSWSSSPQSLVLQPSVQPAAHSAAEDGLLHHQSPIDRWLS